MKFRTFVAFVGPSLFMMLVFIAYPLVAVLIQSFQIEQPVYDTVEVEVCSPGFVNPICNVEQKSVPRLDENNNIITKTSWVGFQSYANVLEFGRAWESVKSFDFGGLQSIDFWKALRFTLTFTFITLPFALVLGMAIALTINNATPVVRGPVIFVSLLPFIITPVIGALSINWLFRGDGIITSWLEYWLGRDLSFFAQAWTIETLMMTYRVWHIAPFAAIIFYAGLQTVNQDTLDSAVVDGASRWQRLRYVVVAHLMPLIIFVSIIHLMDSYRVFEEVVGFSSQSYVISLQWMTYEFLIPDDAGNRAISRASASAMLTMIGVVIILVPLLRRTWRDHKRGALI